VHLAVGDRHPCLRDQLPHVIGRIADGLHPVVQVERLPLARQLSLNGGAHDLIPVLADVGPDLVPAARRRLYDRDVADAAQRHLQRARDGGRREAHHVGLQAQLAEQLFLPHAEALLLVDDDQAQVVRDHVP